jgi:hypothetical protein
MSSLSSASAATAVPVLALMPTARPIIYLGMDVHKESMTIAALPAGAKAPTAPRAAAQ